MFGKFGNFISAIAIASASLIATGSRIAAQGVMTAQQGNAAQFVHSVSAQSVSTATPQAMGASPSVAVSQIDLKTSVAETQRSRQSLLVNAVGSQPHFIETIDTTPAIKAAPNAAGQMGYEITPPTYERRTVEVPPTEPTRSTAIASVQPSLSAMITYPLAQVAPVTSPFGMRWGRLHAGTDLGVAIGTPVLAALPGKVVVAEFEPGYGNYIVLQHNGAQTLYGHLSEILVAPGQSIGQGQLVARSGSTGRSTGPHLHFEMRTLNQDGDWQPIDAENQLIAAQQKLQHSKTEIADHSLFQLSQFQPSQLSQSSFQTVAAMPVSSSTVEIRVLLADRVSAAQIASSTPAFLTDAQHRPISLVPGMQNFTTSPLKSYIQVNGWILPSTFFLEPTAGGMVSVGNQWYRGRVMVALRDGRLTVVNQVGLEQYLYSVVGSEMIPSWNIEALKAQAIAARSYAMYFRYHPASDLYDIGANTRYQAYNGVETEFNTTQSAVEQTASQVLVDLRSPHEPLFAQYASTDELTREAHGGYGMSQYGAAGLADQGYSHLEILARYYAGAGLSRLLI